MSDERDPRVDPRVGDELVDGGGAIVVTAIDLVPSAGFRGSSKRIHFRERGEACWLLLLSWCDEMGGAEIVRRAGDR